MTQIIFGIAGKIASGKDTVADYLQKKLKGRRQGFSDSLETVLNIYDLPITRANLQKLSTLLRQNFSEDILAKAMAKRIRETKDKVIIIDGVRRKTDIQNFQTMKNFYLIYVETAIKIRFSRYIKRNQAVGDQTMTFEEFKQKDNAESEIQIDNLKTNANFVINNNGSLEELYQQIDKIINLPALLPFALQGE